MRKTVIFLMFSCLFLLLAACTQEDKDTADKDTKVIKLGTGINEHDFQYEGLLKFKENIESKTEGGIEVQLYPGNQLGGDKEALDSIADGNLQMNIPGPAVLGDYAPEFTLLTLPFLFPTAEIANEIVDGEVGQELFSKLESKGLVGLGFSDYGFRHVSNDKHKIENIEDFKDLKIRTMENPAHLDVFRKLGTNPTPMPGGEIFSALQQGVIDGQENPITVVDSLKFYEAQKYLTRTAHVYDWTVFVIGKDFYDDLTSDEQQIIQDSVDIAIQDIRSAVTEATEDSIQVLEEEGMIITEPSDEFRQEMQEKVEPVVNEYGEKINPDLYKKIKEKVEEKVEEKSN